MAKLSHRLRTTKYGDKITQWYGRADGLTWGSHAPHDAADLLDEIEQVIQEALRGDNSASWRMKSVLQKLQSDEQ